MARIAILGAGESGTGAAVLAKVKGFDVFLSDMSPIKDKYKAILEQYGIPYEEGHPHTEELVLNADEVIKSPGIPLTAPLIVKLMQQGTPIISEIEFAGRYTQAKMICITGSNGKTTTTMMTYHILKSNGLKVGLAGNVGKSLALQVALEDHEAALKAGAKPEELIDNEYYVIELSSFQLDNMYKFHANISVIMNITPDHMDRYDHQMQNYINSKLRIVQNQTPSDYVIYWNGDPIVARELERRLNAPADGEDYTGTNDERPDLLNADGTRMYPFSGHIEPLKANLVPFTGKNLKEMGDKPLLPGAYLKDGKLVINLLDAALCADTTEIPLDELPLPGPHNLYNTMAATISARLSGLKNEQIRQALATFRGVEHRLEKCGVVDSVEYINDSKATNVNSCWYALMSMTKPTVLILGGKDKGNDYTEIEQLVKDKCTALVYMGLHNEKLHDFFDKQGKPVADALSMREALEKCRAFARPGDTVLLSPCCASFDLFKSYEDRGDQMKAVVAEWIAE